MYKVKLYNRAGDCIGERYTTTLQAAEDIRTKHAAAIGLEPEPTYKHFALYPTIWEQNDSGDCTRLLGY